MTDTDEAAFLRTICAYPHDDRPRLVYSDWLDERQQPGDNERAEFIRLQIEIATTPEDFSHACSDPDGPPGDCETCRPFIDRRKREVELLTEFGPRWYEEFGRQITGGTECATWSVEGVQPHGWMVFGGDWAVQREPFHKGFVGHVTGTLAWLIGGECERCGGRGGHGGFDGGDAMDECPHCKGTGRTPGHLRELVRQHPVTRATVTDRKPEQGPGGPWVWHDSSCRGTDEPSRPSDLPHEVFARLGPRDIRGEWEFPTPQAALAALSAALLAWARKEQP